MTEQQIVQYYNENGQLPIEISNYETWKSAKEQMGLVFESVVQAYSMWQNDVAIAKGFVEIAQGKEHLVVAREGNEIAKDGNSLSYQHNQIETEKALSLMEQSSATRDMAQTAQASLALDTATKTQRVWEEQRDAEGNVVFRGFVDKPYDENFLQSILGTAQQDAQKEWNMNHLPCRLVGIDGVEVSIDASPHADYTQGGFDYTRYTNKAEEVATIVNGTYTNHASPDFTRSVEIRGTMIKVDVPSYITEQDINSYVFRELEMGQGVDKADIARNFFANKDAMNKSYEQGASYGMPNRSVNQEQQNASYGMPNQSQQSKAQDEAQKVNKPKFKGVEM